MLCNDILCCVVLYCSMPGTCSTSEAPRMCSTSIPHLHTPSSPAPSLRASCLSALGQLATSRFGVLKPQLISFPAEIEQPKDETMGAAGTPSLVPPLPFLHTRISRHTLLRRMCQVAGLRVVSRDLDFSAPNPFTTDDIVSLVPLVSQFVEYPSYYHRTLLSAMLLLHP